MLVPDVCVVGSGPAGLVTCLGLARAGRSVLLLESGRFTASRRAQALNDGDHVGASYAGLRETRHRQVGGSANIWNTPVLGRMGAKFVPLDRRDLVSWPIDWTELQPYYSEAQVLCGLGPMEYQAEYWATEEVRPLALEGTGLTSQVYQFGLANSFTDRLVRDLRSRAGITILPSATVVGLVRDRDGARVEGVRVADRKGRLQEFKAGAVVLACGAVENARLLLLAGMGGPGLRWLGRGFMEHPRDYSLTLLPDSPALYAKASFYDLHQSRSGHLIAGRLALTEEAQSAFRLPNASVTLLARPGAHTRRGLRDQVLRTMHSLMGVEWKGGHGWSRVPSPERTFDAFNLVVNMEQRPDLGNRIELANRTDRFANPLPRLVWQWSDQEQADLERLRDLLGKWFKQAGVGRLVIVRGQRPDLNARHHAGTTRMGADAAAGVVDSESRVFGVENLYVAGASVFPTAGFANPTLTIVALSLRLAHHLTKAS